MAIHRWRRKVQGDHRQQHLQDQAEFAYASRGFLAGQLRAGHGKSPGSLRSARHGLRMGPGLLTLGPSEEGVSVSPVRQCPYLNASEKQRDRKEWSDGTQSDCTSSGGVVKR